MVGFGTKEWFERRCPTAEVDLCGPMATLMKATSKMESDMAKARESTLMGALSLDCMKMISLRGRVLINGQMVSSTMVNGRMGYFMVKVSRLCLTEQSTMDCGIWVFLKAWVFVNTQMAVLTKVNGTKASLTDMDVKCLKMVQHTKETGSMAKPRDSV